MSSSTRLNTTPNCPALFRQVEGHGSRCARVIESSFVTSRHILGISSVTSKWHIAFSLYPWIPLDASLREYLETYLVFNGPAPMFLYFVYILRIVTENYPCYMQYHWSINKNVVTMLRKWRRGSCILFTFYEL